MGLAAFKAYAGVVSNFLTGVIWCLMEPAALTHTLSRQPNGASRGIAGAGELAHSLVKKVAGEPTAHLRCFHLAGLGAPEAEGPIARGRVVEGAVAGQRP